MTTLDFCRRLLFLAALVMLTVSCAGTKPKSALSPEEKFRDGLEKYEARKFADARLLFESLIFENPGAVVADSSQYLVGMCYYNQKDFELAAGEFQRFVVQYPSSPLVDDAELMRARCFFYGAPKNIGLDQNYTTSCVNFLQAFKDDYPTSELLPAADTLLAACWERLSKRDFQAGKLYYRMKAYRAAQVYLQLVLDQYPDSPYVPETLYLMGESYRHREVYDSALIWYEKLVYLYPENKTTPKAQKRIRKIQPLLPEPVEANPDSQP